MPRTGDGRKVFASELMTGTDPDPAPDLAEVARRVRADCEGGGDPPIFLAVGSPVVGEDVLLPWDGVGPDLGPVLARLSAVRVPVYRPETELERVVVRLLRGLAGDVEALVGEVRVRRAAGPGGGPVEVGGL